MSRSELLRQCLEYGSIRPALNESSIFLQGDWEGHATCDAVKSELERIFRRYAGLVSIKVLPSPNKRYPPHTASSRGFLNFETAQQGAPPPPPPPPPSPRAEWLAGWPLVGCLRRARGRRGAWLAGPPHAWPRAWRVPLVRNVNVGAFAGPRNPQCQRATVLCTTPPHVWQSACMRHTKRVSRSDEHDMPYPCACVQRAARWRRNAAARRCWAKRSK